MSLPPAEWFAPWEGLPLAAGESRPEAAQRFRRDLEGRAAAGAVFQDDQAVVVLRREPWDCDRLGIEAGKLDAVVAFSDDAGARAVSAALDAARERKLLHLAARSDTRDRRAGLLLQRAGFYLVDTVVTLATDRQPRWGEAPSNVRRATVADAEALARMAGDAFSRREDTYNRYLNDPHLSEQQVREVYATWARTSIGGPAADLTLVVEEEGALAGFLTLFAPEGKPARVPLNAVAREHRGKGLYRRLVRAAEAEAWRSGAPRLEIVTQLQQLAVQRTWFSLGAQPVSSAHTFHAWLG